MTALVLLKPRQRELLGLVDSGRIGELVIVVSRVEVICPDITISNEVEEILRSLHREVA